MDDSGTVHVVERLQRLIHVEEGVLLPLVLISHMLHHAAQVSWDELHRNEDRVEVIGGPNLVDFGDVRVI